MAKEKLTYEELMAGKKEEIKAGRTARVPLDEHGSMKSTTRKWTAGFLVICFPLTRATHFGATLLFNA